MGHGLFSFNGETYNLYEGTLPTYCGGYVATATPFDSDCYGYRGAVFHPTLEAALISRFNTNRIVFVSALEKDFPLPPNVGRKALYDLVCGPIKEPIYMLPKFTKRIHKVCKELPKIPSHGEARRFERLVRKHFSIHLVGGDSNGMDMPPAGQAEYRLLRSNVLENCEMVTMSRCRSHYMNRNDKNPDNFGWDMFCQMYADILPPNLSRFTGYGRRMPWWSPCNLFRERAVPRRSSLGAKIDRLFAEGHPSNQFRNGKLYLLFDNMSQKEGQEGELVVMIQEFIRKQAKGQNYIVTKRFGRVYFNVFMPSGQNPGYSNHHTAGVALSLDSPITLELRKTI